MIVLNANIALNAQMQQYIINIAPDYTDTTLVFKYTHT